MDSGYYYANSCVSRRKKIKPDDVENAVFKAMKNRINEIEIAKKGDSKPDSKTESIKAEVIKLDEEIDKLLDKLTNADDVVFDYINKRIKELHSKKASLEESLRNQERKHRHIDTSPLSEPLRNWDNLTVQEKHEVAMLMIEVIYISDTEGIDIRFSI